MTRTVRNDPNAAALFEAIADRTFEKIKELLDVDPDLINSVSFINQPVLMAAAESAHGIKDASAIELCKFLVERGAKINDGRRTADSALDSAINSGDWEVAEYFLKNGADPNIGRTFFGAMRNEKGNGVKCVQLLIDYGADVNRVFAIFGDRKAAQTALDFAGTRERYVTLLKAAGAKTAKEVLAENPTVFVDGVEE